MSTIANHHPLVKAVASALRRRCGVLEGARILVAVSGGADSVALARVMHTLKNRRQWRLELTVGHVQHHLRGEQAEVDAQFVKELASQLKLPCLRTDLDAPAIKGNVEAWARRERYRALVEMAQARGTSFIATAHHGDDQLETLLMRMLRGAGIRGMSGMRWKGSGECTNDECANVEPAATHAQSAPLTLIRPMLAVTRNQIIDYLTSLNQPWREDHTNADLTRWRARLRAEVLPVLEDIRPGAGRRATAFADHLHEVHQILDDAVRKALESVEHQGEEAIIKRETGRQLRRVVLSGLLRKLLEDAGVPGDKLSAKQIGSVVKAMRDSEGGERVFEFAGGVTVRITRDQVSIVGQ